MTDHLNRRLLLIDDTPAIHEDFRRILGGGTSSALDAAKAALFGDFAPAAPAAAEQAGGPFEMDSAYQGQEGLAKVEQSAAAGRPYALAFVDMRMPPGWDGVETIERLWQADPRLQVVICTAYSDTSWEEVLRRLDARDRLLVLKKPFDTIEVRQLANALTAKWSLSRGAELHIGTLEQAVAARTSELTQAVEALRAEIAERKQLESQLVQSEKLASIGQLAAGVAHEINNPIGYVLSNFSMLEEYLASLFELLGAYELQLPAHGEAALRALRERLQIDDLKEDVPGLMRESKEGIGRVRAIVQDLKDFSRIDSSQEWLLVDLHQGIDSTLNIVASEVRYRADVVKDYGSLPAVECLPSQLNQVMLNLVVNAAQAMGTQRGTITIRTGCEGGQAWIEVADTGGGIAPEHLSRIFDPFFTTKPIGQGTGLGLSLSYGIVKKHRGDISVRSEVGQGTTFRITLPLRQATTAATAAAAPAAAAAA